MYTLSTKKHIPYPVATVDNSNVGSAIAFFKDLATVTQNTTNQTADVLVEDQLHSLDLATVSKE